MWGRDQLRDAEKDIQGYFWSSISNRDVKRFGIPYLWRLIRTKKFTRNFTLWEKGEVEIYVICLFERRNLEKINPETTNIFIPRFAASTCRHAFTNYFPTTTNTGIIVAWKRTEILVDEWHVFIGFVARFGLSALGGRSSHFEDLFPSKSLWFRATSKRKFLRLNSEKVGNCSRRIHRRCNDELSKGRCTGRVIKIQWNESFNPTLPQLTCGPSRALVTNACHNAPSINHNSTRHPPKASPFTVTTTPKTNPFYQPRIESKWKTISLSRYCRKHHRRKRAQREKLLPSQHHQNKSLFATGRLM